jgi:hypothetical protein
MSFARHVIRASALLAVTAAIGLLGSSGRGVQAQSVSQVPSARFFGSITLNGANAPSGATVIAYGSGGSTNCNSTASTQTGTYNGTQYVLDIEGSNAACGPGSTLIFKVNGAQANETGTVPPVSTAVQLNLTVSGSGAGSATVTLSVGWNLVGGPTGTVFSGAANPMYTFQAGDTNYESQSNTTGISGGRGYWAYYSSSATVTLSGSAPLPATFTAPAGQYIMVGNPTTTAVTVSGADVIYTFNTASNSYSSGATSVTLQPGQGAWVFSNAGGTITMQ